MRICELDVIGAWWCAVVCFGVSGIYHWGCYQTGN